LIFVEQSVRAPGDGCERPKHIERPTEI